MRANAFPPLAPLSRVHSSAFRPSDDSVYRPDPDHSLVKQSFPAGTHVSSYSAAVPSHTSVSSLTLQEFSNI